MSLTISNEDLESIRRKAFRTGEDYIYYSGIVKKAWELLLDHKVSIEKRLSSWRSFESAYAEIMRIRKEYPKNCCNEGNRDTFMQIHEELCYQDIENMRKSGELERLNIHFEERVK